MHLIEVVSRDLLQADLQRIEMKYQQQILDSVDPVVLRGLEEREHLSWVHPKRDLKELVVVASDDLLDRRLIGLSDVIPAYIEIPEDQLVHDLHHVVRLPLLDGLAVVETQQGVPQAEDAKKLEDSDVVLVGFSYL